MIDSTRFIPTSRLKQYDVVNKQGQDMGQVQTFVVDMIAGRIAFVVVSFEGFLGISDKWFAIPWDILTWSSETKNFALDMTKEALEKAPGMDKTKWPDEINFDMVSNSYAHFGVAPYWEITDKTGKTNPTVISGVVVPIPTAIPLPTLSSIKVMPAFPGSLAVGSIQQFTATGTYSDKTTADITSKVIWASSNSSVAAISSAGLVTAVGTGVNGTANITAALAGITSQAVTSRIVAAPEMPPAPQKEVSRL